MMILKKSLNPQFFLLIILLSFIFAYWVGLSIIDRSVSQGHVIWGDGMFYYEYLPSVFFDGDLDFRNQRQLLLAQGIHFSWPDILKETTRGHVGTFFPIGWALLTAPFFLIAHTMVHLFSLSVDYPGYGFIYESITNFGSVLGGLAGVLFAFRLLRLFFDVKIALTATFAFLLCSNLPYYMVVQASQSHALGFFAITTAVYYIVKAYRNESPFSKAVFMSGLFLGLAFLIRPQLILTALCLYGYLCCSKNGARKSMLSGLIALPIASTQLYVWYIIYGTALTIPQGAGFMNWANPSVLGLLFSLNHGLFSWHPITIIAILGFTTIFALPREKERDVFLLVCIAVFILQTYINAAACDWWAGNAFGSRRFIDTFIFLIFPLALLINKFKKHCLCWTLIVLLAIWNGLFFVQYRFCYIPRGEAITVRQMFIDKFLLTSIDRSYCP